MGWLAGWGLMTQCATFQPPRPACCGRRYLIFIIRSRHRRQAQLQLVDTSLARPTSRSSQHQMGQRVVYKQAPCNCVQEGLSWQSIPRPQPPVNAALQGMPRKPQGHHQPAAPGRMALTASGAAPAAHCQPPNGQGGMMPCVTHNPCLQLVRDVPWGAAGCILPCRCRAHARKLLATRPKPLPPTLADTTSAPHTAAPIP